VARGNEKAATDPRGALRDYDEALHLNPRSLPALQNKAYVLDEKLGRTRESLAVLDRLLGFRPDSVPSLAGRAVLLARLGKRT
ncbi:hypothetical protein ACEV99_22765, partial [Vibrio parahaemolyticus]